MEDHAHESPEDLNLLGVLEGRQPLPTTAASIETKETEIICKIL